jgi:hypothetical protein
MNPSDSNKSYGGMGGARTHSEPSSGAEKEQNTHTPAEKNITPRSMNETIGKAFTDPDNDNDS